MTSQFKVRKSKFRHVYGSAFRRENCYEHIRITQDTHDSNCCAVNSKFLAVITQVAGGGAFCVLPLHQTGRQEVNSLAKVTGHRGPVLDLKWSPFDDHIIASTSEDTTVRVWRIPDDFSGSLSESVAELKGHKRRSTYVEWHPAVKDILVSTGFDHVVIVWNVATASIVHNINCHSDVIYSVSLNFSGSRLATTCRDKKLRIFDTRTGKLLAVGPSHIGTKPSKVVYLGKSGKLLTTGFSRQSDRQYAVWSEDNLATPLRMETIDSSSGTLFPFYDADTKMVYVAGKGDGNIRFYEIVDGEPWIHYLGQYMSGYPQRGLCALPKRSLNTDLCEIFRFYKLHATRDLCEPISMVVPRKNQIFHDDLYPDTAAPVPALGPDDWILGQDAEPVLQSMKTGEILRELVKIPLVEEQPVSGGERAESGYEDLPTTTDDEETATDSESSDAECNRSRKRIDKKNSRVREMIELLEEQSKTKNKMVAEAKSVKITKNLGNKLQQHRASRPQRSMTQPIIVTLPPEPAKRRSSLTSSSQVKSAKDKPIEIIDMPASYEELRRAYENQREEISQLKKDLLFKERKIRELQDQINLIQSIKK